ncbi:MAG TPA: tryptophan--tRNA ligase [Candidatus Kaiserbacteria bacterium]|nr:tryptophan--tRNA ligase [Candidatus Kaiserbacteria bacterium]
MSAREQILLSAIKPTGEIHIGNYFGAMRQWVDLCQSKKYKTFIMVADYHALNFVHDAKEMLERTREVILTYLAIGLNRDEVIFFKQSDVLEHTELAWIFDTITTMPYLEHAHAFKDARAKDATISVGTFNYPMLMAADILLYDTNVVPVGEDQKQHIEIARDTAQKFNHIYKDDVFILPEAYIMPSVSTVPGVDGRKMSKSYGNTIPLLASHEMIEKSVMGIVTDSSAQRPEIVYAIHSLVRGKDELDKIYKEHEGKYKVLKEMLVEDLNTYLSPIVKRYEELEKVSGLVEEILEKGKREASLRASKKMEQVKRTIGVRV